MSNQAEFHANTKRSDSSSADAGGPNAAFHNQSGTPNVRHIPIFVEGRDQPLINRNLDSAQSPSSNQHSSTTTSSSSTTSNANHSKRPTSGPSPNPFDWSRKFSTMGGQQSSAPTGPTQPPQQPSTRSDSPHRTIPISHSAPTSAQHHSATPPSRQHPYAHSQSDGRITPDVHQTQQQHQQQTAASSHNFQNQNPFPQQPQPKAQQPSKPPAEPQYPAQSKSGGAPDVSFSKITQIQCDVLELMDQVERFKGNTRKDRQYLYLDEMLTQNLLKLDTIDTDGRENLKQARREAIKCINKCIGVLEAKADSGAQQQPTTQTQQQQPQNNVPTAANNRNQKRRSKRTKQTTDE